MNQKDDFEEIKKVLRNAVQDHVSSLGAILNYEIHSIDNVRITNFRQEPDLKSLYLGKSIKVFAEGIIHIYHYVGSDKTGWRNRDIEFWCQNAIISYNSDDDSFLVESFDFIPLRN